MMVRKPPPLRIRPRLEVGDRAAQGPKLAPASVKNRCASLKSSSRCTTSARVVASGASARMRAATRIVCRVPQNRRVK